MIAVNIAFDLLKNINLNIKDNVIKFDNNHIVHCSLLQFYCNVCDISKIQRKIKNIKIYGLNINNFTLIIEKNNNNYFIYKYIINNNKLIKIQKYIYKMFYKYIKHPYKNLDKLFVENITNKNILKLVSHYHKNKYNPHITMGISKLNIKINNTHKNINLNNINLYKIGNSGTAIPFVKQTPIYYSHRVNLSSQLKNISNNYGIEIDLRDNNNNIIVSHDPFTDGELFENYLKSYNKKVLF